MNAMGDHLVPIFSAGLYLNNPSIYLSIYLLLDLSWAVDMARHTFLDNMTWHGEWMTSLDLDLDLGSDLGLQLQGRKENRAKPWVWFGKYPVAIRILHALFAARWGHVMFYFLHLRPPFFSFFFLLNDADMSLFNLIHFSEDVSIDLSVSNVVGG
ncbi:hypothetical protein VTN02DRAFT_3185 [Thermoascus thermophilus]